VLAAISSSTVWVDGQQDFQDGSTAFSRRGKALIRLLSGPGSPSLWQVLMRIDK
jgi:hypothetical protein